MYICIAIPLSSHEIGILNHAIQAHAWDNQSRPNCHRKAGRTDDVIVLPNAFASTVILAITT